jgi:hypothetical protein
MVVVPTAVLFDGVPVTTEVNVKLHCPLELVVLMVQLELPDGMAETSPGGFTVQDTVPLGGVPEEVE